MYLRAVGLPGIISGVKPASGDPAHASWVELDEVVYSYIWTLIPDRFQFLIDSADTVSSAFALLKAHFEKSNMSTRMHARQAFYSVRHDPSLPISAYISALEAAKQVLTSLGVDIKDEEFKDVLLMNIDSSFSSAVMTIFTQETEPSLSKVKTLLQACASISPVSSAPQEFPVKVEPVLAFAARPSCGRRTSPVCHSSGSVQYPQDEVGHVWCYPARDCCHRCGRSGHIAARCVVKMPSAIKDWVFANTPRSSSPDQAARGAMVFSSVNFHQSRSRPSSPAPRFTELDDSSRYFG